MARRKMYIDQLYEAWISSVGRVKNLYAMLSKGSRMTAKLSPFVSMKSWRVMEVGSMWCSRNGRMNDWNDTQAISCNKEQCEDDSIIIWRNFIWMLLKTTSQKYSTWFRSRGPRGPWNAHLRQKIFKSSLFSSLYVQQATHGRSKSEG